MDLDDNLNLDNNLDLTNSLDLDANLNLVAINKIEKIRPVNKEIKSDKEKDSYLFILDNKRLTESASLSQIFTYSESALRADKISTFLDIPINLPKGVETQQILNVFETYYTASDPRIGHSHILPKAKVLTGTTNNEIKDLRWSIFQTITSSFANAAFTAAKPLKLHQHLPSHFDKTELLKVRDCGTNLGVG